MKTGLLYVFFVTLILLVVYAGQNDKKTVNVELATRQYINVECTIPEVSLSLNTNFSDLIFARLIIENHFENSHISRLKLAQDSNKLYLLKAIEIIPLIQKPFRQIIHYTSDKQDYSYLA